MTENNSDSDESADGASKHRPIRNAVDLQRMKLEKLMKNPSKPVYIPDTRKDKKFPDAPEFVRNVMGSSAGAGSGEFHVYRHIRRREYSREMYMQKCKEKAELDEEHQLKIEKEKQLSEDKMAKKRKKRQKRKERRKEIRSKRNTSTNSKKSDSDSSTESDLEESGKDSDKQQITNTENDCTNKDSIRKEKLLLLKNSLDKEKGET